MSEHDVIKAVPTEVKKVLKYIQQLLLDKNYNSTLEFSNVVVHNKDICILKIHKYDGCEQVPIKILSKYDYLFYLQLFISILDIYLDHFEVTGIYPDNNKFDYYFFLDNINIKVSATHDLKKLVDYYNERVIAHKNSRESGIKK